MSMQRSPIQPKDLRQPSQIPLLVEAVRELQNTYRMLSSSILAFVAKEVEAQSKKNDLILEQAREEVLPSDERLLSLIEPLIPEVSDGKTPTKEELLELIRPLIPKIRDGVDGNTPTREELLAIIKPLLPTEEKLSSVVKKLIPKPKEPEKAPTIDEILKALFESKRFSLDEIVGLRPYLENFRRALMRGGGDTIAAGSGITIAQSNGVKTISASVGTTLTQETPTGAVNGSNVTFTTTNTPLFIIVDGMFRVSGQGYTYSSPTITVDSAAPPVSFIRSFYAA